MNFNANYSPQTASQPRDYNINYRPMNQQKTEGHYNGGRATTKIGGKWSQIAFCFLIMTIPMLLFSALLLGLVYTFRIKDSKSTSPNLTDLTVQLSKDAVYVNLSATLLTTVASWCSTVAPILVGSAVTLLTFPIAKGLLGAARLNRPDRLPTPYQLALMIRMNTANAANSLYHWLQYVLFFRKGRSKQPAALTWMTVVIIISWVLSVLVFATDTWLHVATKSVNIVQISPSTDLQNLTFALMPGCTTSNNSYEASSLNACLLNPAASTTFLMRAGQYLQVVNNVSASMAVQTVVEDGVSYVYMGNAKQDRLANLDYSAQTYAITTDCKPITSSCMDSANFFGAGTPYNCPFNFAGDLAQAPWAMGFFTDSSMEDNNTLTGIQNPYYFALATAQNQAIGAVNQALLNDPEMLTSTHGATVFALSCSSTLYDVEYSLVNGTISRWETTQSNTSIANMFQSTQDYTEAGTNQLQQAASLAMFSNTSTEVADSFAQAYSRVVMSLAAGGLQSTPGLEAQNRNSIIAARVPYAPLVALILANLLLVLLGIVLTVLAVFSAGGDAGEAQARLSLQAIVAQIFEKDRARGPVDSIDAMYDEYHGCTSQKVGVIKTEEGGWTFGSWRVAQ